MNSQKPDDRFQTVGLTGLTRPLIFFGLLAP